MDKVENLECLYQGDGILEKEWVTDSQRNSILQGKVSMYAKYVPNPSIISQDIRRETFLGSKQGP